MDMLGEEDPEQRYSEAVLEEAKRNVYYVTESFGAGEVVEAARRSARRSGRAQTVRYVIDGKQSDQIIVP